MGSRRPSGALVLRKGGSFKNHLNPEPIDVRPGCKLEPSLASAEPGQRFLFERLGYFCADTVDSKPGTPVFNQAVALRDA